MGAFAQFNPNPVLELLPDGTLNYFNPAAWQMARSLDQEHPQAILPRHCAMLVKTCLATGQSRLDVQVSLRGRTISWSLFPIISKQVVHCYAEDITARLNMEAQLRQMQKIECVGQLAAGVAHDFNNILTIIHGHAGLILSDLGLDPILADSARQISLAAERAASLTRQLLMISRKQVMQPQLLDLNDVVANVSKMLRSLAGEQIALRRTTAPDLPPIHADAGMLEQVLLNLTINARDAMPDGGTLSITTFSCAITQAYVQGQPEAREGYFAGLSVSDTGHGMDSRTISRIFEPFFTTKQAGQGTGLGLATVHAIIRQHQGWVEVQSEVGQGTTFKIFLPAASKARMGRQPARVLEPPGGEETILVVEDESSLRSLIRDVLRKKGYTVLEAGSGVDALKIWQQHQQNIHLLLVDMMLPDGVSGREVARRALKDKPALKVIYSSGYSLEVVSPDFNLAENTNFLQKPYHPQTLARAVRKKLDS